MPILVQTGKGKRTHSEDRAELEDVSIFSDLAAFANALVPA